MRVLAGALSAAPIGFAAGAVLSGRYLIVTGGPAGIAILIFAMLGAVVAAAIMASAAAVLPPKPARIATIAAGGVSFAILVYMVQDFIVDRIAQGRIFDEAYARIPSFELTLESTDRQRRPYSQLTFTSDRGLDTRDYTALRPGGWLCRGRGRREHELALFQGIRAAEDAAVGNGGCRRRATWQVTGEARVAQRCADQGQGFAALFAVADEMIDTTQRYASCRRASSLQSAQPAATIDG